jgi:hypothetical protein
MKLKFVFIAVVMIACNYNTTKCPLEDECLKKKEFNFLHSVYFWLNDSVSEADKCDFEKGLMALGAVESIGKYEYGKPAGTKREVVDNSFDYSWIVYFANKDMHDKYQIDSIHLSFVNNYSHLWDSVVVYDTKLEY